MQILPFILLKKYEYILFYISPGYDKVSMFLLFKNIKTQKHVQCAREIFILSQVKYFEENSRCKHPSKF